MSNSGNAHQLFKWNGEVNARHTRTRECKRGQAREKEWTERGGKKIYAIESVHGYKSVILRVKLG